MQMLIFVLNNVDLLDDVLAHLSASGIRGATIISSTGMAHQLAQLEDDFFFGNIRKFLANDREESKTIFMVLPQEHVQVARNAIVDVVGDLTKPNTGILFSIPTLFVEGILEP